jgi:hypothetical protein
MKNGWKFQERLYGETMVLKNPFENRFSGAETGKIETLLDVGLSETVGIGRAKDLEVRHPQCRGNVQIHRRIHGRGPGIGLDRADDVRLRRPLSRPRARPGAHWSRTALDLPARAHIEGPAAAAARFQRAGAGGGRGRRIQRQRQLTPSRLDRCLPTTLSLWRRRIRTVERVRICVALTVRCRSRKSRAAIGHRVARLCSSRIATVPQAPRQPIRKTKSMLDTAQLQNALVRRQHPAVKSDTHLCALAGNSNGRSASSFMTGVALLDRSLDTASTTESFDKSRLPSRSVAQYPSMT